jgi:hypothetical protein
MVIHCRTHLQRRGGLGVLCIAIQLLAMKVALTDGCNFALQFAQEVFKEASNCNLPYTCPVCTTDFSTLQQTVECNLQNEMCTPEGICGMLSVSAVASASPFSVVRTGTLNITRGMKGTMSFEVTVRGSGVSCKGYLNGTKCSSCIMTECPGSSNGSRLNYQVNCSNLGGGYIDMCDDPNYGTPGPFLQQFSLLKHHACKKPTQAPTRPPTSEPTQIRTRAPTKAPTKAPTPLCPARASMTFELWDGDTNKRLTPIKNGGRYCLQRNWNIRAVTRHESSSCGPVNLSLLDSGGIALRKKKDSAPKFFLLGDNSTSGDVYGNTNTRPKVASIVLASGKTYCVKATEGKAAGSSQACFTQAC